jgi:hypothetical protein
MVKKVTMNLNLLKVLKGLNPEQIKALIQKAQNQ